MARGASVAQPMLILAVEEPSFRARFRKAVSGSLLNARFADAATYEALQLALAANAAPDLVFLDVGLPGTKGFYSLLSLRAEYPNTVIIVVSPTEDHGLIHRALDLGASGILAKSACSKAI